MRSKLSCCVLYLAILSTVAAQPTTANPQNGGDFLQNLQNGFGNLQDSFYNYFTELGKSVGNIQNSNPGEIKNPFLDFFQKNASSEKGNIFGNIPNNQEAMRNPFLQTFQGINTTGKGNSYGNFQNGGEQLRNPFIDIFQGTVSSSPSNNNMRNANLQRDLQERQNSFQNFLLDKRNSFDDFQDDLKGRVNLFVQSLQERLAFFHNNNKKVPENVTESTCPDIVSRAGWGARPQKVVEYMIVPVQYVIIQHTATPMCMTASECVARVAGTQAFHMDTLHFNDIGFSFLIGGDGKVYEGVGWHKIGAHTRGYNSKALGIAVIGNFMDKLPNENQLTALKKLLSCGISIGEIDPDYKLLAHRQVSATESPGATFFQELQKWPQWAEQP